MSFNRFMHERNYYRTTTPDFRQLAEKHPELKAFLIEKKNGGVTLDFRNPNAVRALTIASAKEDFQLDLELSLDRLIPRIPQKLNYLHWIEDLLERKNDAVGIDIGSGCSCIHALLALRLNPQWTMYTSEIDPVNYRMAVQNVERNHLQDRIHVVQMDPSALFDGLIDRTIHYDFLMCNPPFYTDALECQGVTNSRTAARPSANSINTGADIESIYQGGGEVEFVRRMIDESKTYSTTVRVFTSQLGKKSSLEQMKKHLGEIRHIETEFCQGNTMRWGVAWTFDDQYHFSEHCQTGSAFKALKKAKRKESTRTPICIPFDAKYSFSTIKTYLEKHLVAELKLRSTSLSPYAWIWDAYENHWSHQRRRRRHHDQDPSVEDDEVPPSKRLKAEQNETNKLCSIQVRLDESEGVTSLYLLFVDGSEADSANQIGQYIKNTFPLFCQTKLDESMK